MDNSFSAKYILSFFFFFPRNKDSVISKKLLFWLGDRQQTSFHERFLTWGDTHKIV